MKKARIMENIYDLIKATTIGKQDDDWATLSREHEREARQELYGYLRDKHIEWDNENIRIGKHITITIK